MNKFLAVYVYVMGWLGLSKLLGWLGDLLAANVVIDSAVGFVGFLCGFFAVGFVVMTGVFEAFRRLWDLEVKQ